MEYLVTQVSVHGDPLGLGPRQQQSPHPLLPFANQSLFRSQEAQSHTAIFRVIKGQKNHNQSQRQQADVNSGSCRVITKALFGTCHGIICPFPSNKRNYIPHLFIGPSYGFHFTGNYSHIQYPYLAKTVVTTYIKISVPIIVQNSKLNSLSGLMSCKLNSILSQKGSPGHTSKPSNVVA